jgi:hypothetical protein
MTEPAKAPQRAKAQNVESLEAHGYKHSIWLDPEGDELHVWARGENYSNVFAMWPKLGDTLPYVYNLPQDFLKNYRRVEPA